MQLPRRRFVHLTTSAAALVALPRLAKAQSYPARPVRLIVPFGPAGATDIVARLIGQWLSERLGQSFVIENRRRRQHRHRGGRAVGARRLYARADGVAERDQRHAL
jgi:hypothetical protein